MAGIPQGPREAPSEPIQELGGETTSPLVPVRPANPGQFATRLLPGFRGTLVSPREAARVLGVNRETIYRMIARGELRAVRVGSALRIDLLGFVAERLASK
jgi:excisionase family DNA binding protein